MYHNRLSALTCHQCLVPSIKILSIPELHHFMYYFITFCTSELTGIYTFNIQEENKTNERKHKKKQGPTKKS